MHTSANQTDATVFAAAAGGEFVRRLAIGGASLSLLTGALYANPAGEQIVAGNVGITRNGNLTQITASNGAAINWNSFNIGANHTVEFIQPGANSRVLNRVTGPDPTSIAGTLLANGRVYIVNPAGVFFRAGAVVNAGAIYAAAGKISDADFARKLDRFSDMTGSVVNDGAIRAAQVVLTGASVGNAGRIDSPQGTVIMASGSDVLIGERGGSMYARVTPGAAASLGAAPGVSNTGVVNARGGTYQAVTGDIFGMAIRQGGQVIASRIQVQGGNATTTTVDGSLDASGRDAGQRGGKIEVTGDRVALLGASLDASGSAGGGVVNVGGGYQGRGEIANAGQTIVDANSTINVDAIDRGHGGQAVVWSDRYTLYRGHISAKGSRADGNGGSVEVSGKDTLAFRGTVNASGQGRGKGGTLLLDPKNITVADTGPDALANNTTFADNAAGDVVFDADTLTAVLNNGTALELQANTDITINEAITVNNAGGDGGTLTLRAGRSVISTVDINTDNGAFFAFANDVGATTNRDANPGVITFTGTTLTTGTGAATFSVGTNALAGASGGAINLGTINAASIIADSTGAATPGSGSAGANTGAVIVNAVLTTTTGGITLRGGTVTTNAGGSLDTNGAAAAGTVALTATAGDVVVGDTVATTGGAITLSASGDVMINAAVQTTGAAFTATADSDGSGAGTFSNAAGGTVNTTNAGADGTITITAADANLADQLTAGTANFIFAPSANTDIDLGDAATGAGFGLANSDLGNLIGSGSVTIGDNATTFVTNITIDNATFGNITAGMGNTLTLRAARSNNSGTISFDASSENFQQFAGGLFVRGTDAVTVSQTITASTIDLQAGSDGTGNLALNNNTLLQADTITLTAGSGAGSASRVTFGGTASFRNQAGAAVPGNVFLISDAAIGSGGTDTNLPAATAFNAGGDLTGMAYALTSLNGITLTDATQTNNANLTLNNTTSGVVTFNAAGAFTFTGLNLNTNILELAQNTTITGPGAAMAFGQIRTNADNTFYNLTVNVNDAGTLNFNHDIGGADVAGVPNARGLGDFSIQSATGGSVAFTGQGGGVGITQYINVGTLTVGTGGAVVNTTINATTLTQVNARAAATGGATSAVSFEGTLLSANVAAQRDLTINLNANGANLIFVGNVGDTNAPAATQRIGILTVAGTGTGTTTNLPASLNVESGSIGNAVVLNQDSTVRAFGTNAVGFLFGSTVDSDNVTARALTVNTPNGAFTTFSGDVGNAAGAGVASTTKLASLSTDATGVANFVQVFTTGAQTLQGSAIGLNGALYNSDGSTITIGETGANNSVITINTGNVTTLASQGAGAAGDIRLAGTVEGFGQGTDSLTVNTAGTTTFSAAIGGVNPLLNVLTDAPGSVTARSITLNDPTGNVGGIVTFNENTITLNGNYVTNGGNFNARPIANPTTAAITIAGNTTVNSNNGNTNAGGLITFNGTIDDSGGGFSLGTTTNNLGGSPGAAGTQFLGNVGSGTALASLTTAGTGDVAFITPAGAGVNVTTTGNQLFNNTGGLFLSGTNTTTVNGAFFSAGPTILSGNTTVNTSASAAAGTIFFNGTVDSGNAGGTPFSLGTNSVATANAGGLGTGTAGAGTQFNGLVGSGLAGTGVLASLTTQGALGTVSAVGVRTGGNQAFNNTGSTTLSGTFDTAVDGSTAAATGAFNVAGNALIAANGTNVNTSASTGQNGTILFSGTVDSTSGNTFSFSTTSLVGAPADTAGTTGTRFVGAVGATDALASLTTNGAAGSVSLANVTTTGNQAYNNTGNTFLNGTYSTTANGTFATTGPAFIGGATVVTTGSGTITFGNTVDDANAAGTNALTTRSSTTTQFSGTVGATRALLRLTTNDTAVGAGTLNLTNNVTTTGDQTYNNGTVNISDGTGATTTVTLATTANGAVNFASAAGNVALTDNLTVTTGSGDITFGGTVRGASIGSGNLVTTSSGATSFNGVVGGGGLALATLTTNGVGVGQPGTLNVRGNITTIGAQNYNQATINIDDNNVANNTLTFSTVNNGLLFNNSAGNILLTDNLTLVINGGGSAIVVSPTVNDAVAGTHTLTANQGGATSFNNTIGAVTPLLSVVVDGNTVNNGPAALTGILNVRGNISTRGNQTFNVATANINDALGAVNTITLDSNSGGGNGTVNFQNAAGNTVLTDNLAVTAGSGQILFAGTVNGATAGTQSLTTTSTNAGATAATAGTQFNGAIGAGTALSFLQTNGAAGTVSAVNVTTTGGAGQAFQNTGTTFLNGTYSTADGTFAVTGPTRLQGSSIVMAGAGTITFTGAVDDVVAGTTSLTTTSTSAGGTNFATDVGAAARLLSLTTNGAGSFTNFTETASGGQVVNAGTMTFNNGVTVAHGTLTTFDTSVGNVAFNSTLDSDGATPRNVTTNTSAAATSTVFASDVGLTNRIGTLTTGGNATSSTQFTKTAGGSQVVNTTADAFNNAVTVLHGTLTTFDASVGNVAFNSTLNSAAAAGKNVTTNTSAAASATVFASDVGTTLRLGTLTTGGNAVSSTQFTKAAGGQAVNTGATVFNNAVTVANSGTTTFDADVGNVAFNSTLDSDGATPRNVTTNTSAAASASVFASDVGLTNRLGTLTTGGNATSSTQFTKTAGASQAVRVTGAAFNNAVTIGHGTLTTLDSNGVGALGNVAFASTLNSDIDAGARNFTANITDAGATLSFAADVGRQNATTGVGAVTPRRLGQLVVTGAAASTTAFTAGAGSLGQRIDATGMSFANNVTIANPTLTAFEASGAGALGNVTFTGTLNSSGAFRSARVTTGTGAALATFGGAVGGTSALGQLVVGGNSRINSNVTLNGDARRISTDTTLALLSAPALATDAIQPIALIGTGAEGATAIQPRISFTNTGTLAIGGDVAIAGNNGSLLFGNNINRVVGAGGRSLALTTTAPVLTGTQYDAFTDAQRRAFIQSYIPAVAFGGSVGSTVAGNRLDSFSVNAAGLRGLGTVANNQSILSSVVFSAAYQTVANNFGPLTVATLGGLDTVGNSPTFQVATTGPITFGQNEKVTAFGNLQLLSNAGAITLGDVAAVAARNGGVAPGGNLTIGEAGTTAINVLTRVAGRVATVGAASVSTANDAGVDFVGNSIAFSTPTLTLLGTGANPQFATPTGDQVTYNGMAAQLGTVRLFPVALYRATPPSLLTDGSSAGTANNILALDIRSDGPVPRSDRNAFVNQVDLRGLRPLLDDLAIKTADREQLKKIDLLVRDLPAGEIVDALIGRAVYNDRPGVSDYFGATPSQQSKSAPRLSYDAVAKLVSAFNVLEPDRDAVSVAVTDAFEAVRAKTPGGLFTPEAFAEYAATQGPDTAQGSALARVRELLDLVDLIALSPVEARIVKRAIVKRFGPAGASREELDAMIAGLQKREQLAAR